MKPSEGFTGAHTKRVPLKPSVDFTGAHTKRVPLKPSEDFTGAHTKRVPLKPLEGFTGTRIKRVPLKLSEGFTGTCTKRVPLRFSSVFHWSMFLWGPTQFVYNRVPLHQPCNSETSFSSSKLTHGEVRLHLSAHKTRVCKIMPMTK